MGKVSINPELYVERKKFDFYNYKLSSISLCLALDTGNVFSSRNTIT